MKVEKTKWEKKSFSQTGISQLDQALDSKRNKGKSYPYLCAVNVGYGNFHLTNVKEILMEEDELERYQVLRGDLLICEGGETGRCAIWESDDIMYYQNALMIKGFYIPIPPLPLQQQFATRVEQIEKQKEQIRLQLADAETLMAERMQYYFS